MTQRKITCPKCATENLAWRNRCEKCGEDLHKAELKAPVFEGRGIGFWIAFIAGLIGIAFIAFFAVTAVSFSGGYMLGLLVVPVLGLILCWKWTRTAGILLIIGAFLLVPGMMAIPGIQSDPFYAFGLIFAAVAMIGPLLTSGILFLINDKG